MSLQFCGAMIADVKSERKARPFAPYCASGVQHDQNRLAKGSPFGRAGAKRLRGQARHERTAHAAISRLFVRAMLSLRPRIIVSILALSVTCGDTSPRGRGFVRTGKVCKKLQKPLANFPEMRYNTSRGKSAGNRISASLAQSVRAPDC